MQTDSPGLHMLDIKKALLRSSSANATGTAIDNKRCQCWSFCKQTANATETAIDV